MKYSILAFSLASSLLLSSHNAAACTMLPKGDSFLRVEALHNTLGDMEVLTGFQTLEGGSYKLTIQDLTNNTFVTRTYRLENTSPMCPVYKASLVEETGSK